MPRKHAIVLAALLAAFTTPLSAQQPFYTDDPGVTDQGTWHFEFFNEFDALQHSQYPNLRQNTASYKLNYGLPYNLEIDIDAPYLAIFRDLQQTAKGTGDTNLGVKWNFRQESPGSRAPAMSASLYIEFPTGDTAQQLGSGLTDYWLNFIAQKHLTEKTRVNGNAGILFAGNTSVGALGLENRRGKVFTGGLSVLHEFNSHWTAGVEIFGAVTNNLDLSKGQIQFLTGGTYTIRKGLTFDFGLLGGAYVASPRIGAQIGFSVDVPAVLR